MEKLEVIRTLEALQELHNYIQDKNFIAFDVETNGTDKESFIIGFSICAEVNVGYYVILAEWNVQEQKLVFLETHKGAKAFMQNLVGHNLIMQNAPFDCARVSDNFDVDLMPSVHTDTLILGHLLDENRSNGLKERAIELYGETSAEEQRIMKESVLKNGGVLTKSHYELYKADADLIAHYGAKDAILTMKIFLHDVPILFEQELDKFFYEEESMPLLRGPTYDLNTTGLRVDPEKLQALKATLEAECVEAEAYIKSETLVYVKEKYPGTKKTNHFNINANQQLAWLLFCKLNNEFGTLTEAGKELCKALDMKLPYSMGAKKEFIYQCEIRKGEVWEPAKLNTKTGKMGRPKKIGDPWTYLACGKETLQKLAKKYRWVEKLLEYKKNQKLLNTYVIGIQERMKYGIIRPQFLQNGTTSGRYSSKNPNFQNLPREDKRIKSCIISRVGKVFVGADYSQLEPRVFASVSGDERLMKCFENGEDFYSVIGTEVFDQVGLSLKKDDPNSFAKLCPDERQLSKTIALAATYGASAPQLSKSTGKSMDETQDILDSYFRQFPSVREMMLRSHKEARSTGVVKNLYGRPRRMPEALEIDKVFKSLPHEQLPYELRNILNLAVNHKIQSTGASIMNRAAIAFWTACKRKGWKDVKIVMQIHDELIIEAPEGIAKEVSDELKFAMETTTKLPGVKLVAEPKIANNLAELK